jgi:tetratricopeptide (TPR) repeat protein
MITFRRTSNAWRRLTASLVGAGLLTATALTPAAAQQPTPGPTLTDKVDLVALTTRQPTPDSPPTDVQFEAKINYRLQSIQSGSVLLFLFENGAEESTQDNSNAIPVQRGSGQLVLDINYKLKPNVKSLTLVAGLFRGEQKLLAWVSTNPIDMGPWPGRVAFEKAMTARLNNDFAAADQALSIAIQDAPETGNFYYWRGDTRIRLEDYSDALTDFNRSIDLMPQDRPSHVGRGIAQLWLGDAHAAVDDLSFAIDATKTADRIGAWAYRARGLAHASLGESQAAIADYKSYLDLTPGASDRDQVQAWIADLT